VLGQKGHESQAQKKKKNPQTIGKLMSHKQTKMGKAL
jgi:hypothetical protein